MLVLVPSFFCDALYQSATGTIRIHGAFIDDDEIHSLVKAIKA